jgi:L-lysine 2,3-aminomutase
MLPNPELEELLGQNVEITVTVRGILTGYFDKALVLDVENGPAHFMVMTKEAGFKVDVKGEDRDSKHR